MNWRVDIERAHFGNMTFDDFFRSHRTYFYSWALSFRKICANEFWFDIDDLVQDTMLETYRACLSWEPNGAPLPKWVTYQVWIVLTRKFDRKRLDTEENVSLLSMTLQDWLDRDIETIDYVAANEFASDFEGLDREIVFGIAKGYTLRMISTVLYQSNRYDFSSQASASQTVRFTANRLTRKQQFQKTRETLNV